VVPIENSLDDLWSQMQFINPNILGVMLFLRSITKFPLKKTRRNQSAGTQNLVSPFILRRTKNKF
jgi:non-specific serine/threonine protein kinase